MGTPSRRLQSDTINNDEELVQVPSSHGRVRCRPEADRLHPGLQGDSMLRDPQHANPLKDNSTPRIIHAALKREDNRITWQKK